MSNLRNKRCLFLSCIVCLFALERIHHYADVLYRKIKGRLYIMPRTIYYHWKSSVVEPMANLFMIHQTRRKTQVRPRYQANTRLPSKLQNISLDKIKYQQHACNMSNFPTLFCGFSRQPIQSPPDEECEMSLKQFGSITDLLTKLRADLQASFPRWKMTVEQQIRLNFGMIFIRLFPSFLYILLLFSFVQEFVALPHDGVSQLLEVLRLIQFSQQNGNGQVNTTGKMFAQTYQRRSLLDELACV